MLQNLKSIFSLRHSQLLTGVALSVICSAMNAVYSLPQAEKILLIKQTTNSQGSVLTYVSKDAVKVCFTTLHGHLVAKAPTWKVSLVNDDDKTFYEVDYDTWLKHRIARIHINSDNNEPGNRMKLLEKSPSKYVGKACEQYIFEAYPYNAKFFGLARQGLADPKGCLILDKWFAAPLVDSIPLAFRYFDREGNFVSDLVRKEKLAASPLSGYVDALQCKSVETVDCPKDFFMYPKDYKPVKSEVFVFTSKRQQEMVEELFHDGILK